MCDVFIGVISSIEFWKVVIPAIVAIGIAFLSHQWAVSRQLAEQKKKMRVEYLASSFRSLMMFSNNPRKHEGAEHLREATIAIQFLGNKSQVEMLHGIVDELLKPNGKAELDPLLASLRDELREELNLEKVEGNIYWTHPQEETINPK